MLPIHIVPPGSLHHTVWLFFVALLLLAPRPVLRLFSRSRSASPAPGRAAQSEDRFVHRMMSVGLDPRVARTTYRYLRTRCNLPSPILIGDSLSKDLGLDVDAIHEAVHALLVENGRQVYPASARIQISTVQSLVTLIQASPRSAIRLAA